MPTAASIARLGEHRIAAALTTLLTADGSSTTGWTTRNGTGFVVDSGKGNPSPSWQVIAGGCRSADPGATAKRITYDARIDSGGIQESRFGQDSSGLGLMCRLDPRASQPSGFIPSSTWSAWGSMVGTTTVLTFAASTWYTIVVDLQAATITAKITGGAYSNTQFASYSSYTASGTLVGVQGQLDNNQWLDNLLVEG